LFCAFAALAIVSVSSAAVGGIAVRWLDHRHPSSRVSSAKPAVTIRHLSTGLLDLKLTAFDLMLLDPTFQEYAGAIQLLDDGILIAEATGGFYRLTFETPLKPHLQRLPTHLELNAAAENEVFLRTVKGAYAPNPVRITDLLFLPETDEIAVAHTVWDEAGECITLRVATLPRSRLLAVDHGASTAWHRVFESKPCVKKVAVSHESGGRMFQVEPGSILLTVGHLESDELVMDPSADYGKLLRIRLASGQAERVSTGHRNPQGLTVDHLGRLWLTEHGPRGGDELNLITPGRDYGWPRVTLGTDYNSLSWPLSEHQGRHDGYQPPVFAWMPSIATSNLIEIADFHERWDGDLLVTSLRAESLFRLRLDGERVLYEERLEIGERLRDIAQAAEGTIWLWTDKARLIAVTASDVGATLTAMIELQPPAVAAALARCGACHAFDPGSDGTDRLTLWNVFDRRLGEGANKKLYSEAMLQAAKDGAVWDSARLDDFLADPEDALPGTKMRQAGISDAETRSGIIRFLATLK
jgi:cytochrome c2